MDLHDNNHQLQRQLHEAQDQLELLMVAMKTQASKAAQGGQRSVSGSSQTKAAVDSPITLEEFLFLAMVGIQLQVCALVVQ